MLHPENVESILTSRRSCKSKSCCQYLIVVCDLNVKLSISLRNHIIFCPVNVSERKLLLFFALLVLLNIKIIIACIRYYGFGY